MTSVRLSTLLPVSDHRDTQRPQMFPNTSKVPQMVFSILYDQFCQFRAALKSMYLFGCHSENFGPLVGFFVVSESVISATVLGPVKNSRTLMEEVLSLYRNFKETFPKK